MGTLEMSDSSNIILPYLPSEIICKIFSSLILTRDLTYDILRIFRYSNDFIESILCNIELVDRSAFHCYCKTNNIDFLSFLYASRYSLPGAIGNYVTADISLISEIYLYVDKGVKTKNETALKDLIGKFRVENGNTRFRGQIFVEREENMSVINGILNATIQLNSVDLILECIDRGFFKLPGRIEFYACGAIRQKKLEMFKLCIGFLNWHHFTPFFVSLMIRAGFDDAIMMCMSHEPYIELVLLKSCVREYGIKVFEIFESFYGSPAIETVDKYLEISEYFAEYPHIQKRIKKQLIKATIFSPTMMAKVLML